MLWQPPQSFPLLQVNQVHIWRASLQHNEEQLQDFLEVLNLQEKSRAAKFRVKKAANNFIIGRGILRILLAKYLSIKPQDVIFQQNQYGKLYLNSSLIQFNLSHSHNLALFIFAMNVPVGIDLEFMQQDYNFVDVVKKFFSADEAAALFALPADQQKQAFFNCWSCKEAYIKAIGTGLYSSLNKFSVEVSCNKQDKKRLRVADNGIWSLEALDPADEYSGAFVVGACGYSINFYEFCRQILHM